MEWLKAISLAALIAALMIVHCARADQMQKKTIEAITKTPKVKQMWKTVERRYIPEVVLESAKYYPYIDFVHDAYRQDIYLNYKWRF